MLRRTLFLAVVGVLLLALPSGMTAPAKSATPMPKTAKSKRTTATAKAATPRPKPKAEPVEVYPAEYTGGVPVIQAASAILVDAYTGQTLHEVNADSRRPVASTQKLLTALLVAEEGDLDEEITVVGSDTWAEPSKLYLKAGDEYRRRDLLKILLVKSMNDVARALARDHAGSVEAFAVRMNQRAAQLGMTQSNFVNPNGLPDPDQFSTARDMAKVAVAAYRNRTIRELVRLREIAWKYPSGKVTTFKNTNRVLRNFAACNGMKTGYTEASGFCLISSASHGGRDVIAVVLGDSKTAIWLDSYRLLAWGLSS